MDFGDWTGTESPVAAHVLEQSHRCLRAYAENPILVEQDAAIEISTAEGGYGRKQLYELIQNGADALVGDSGRVTVVLSNGVLYCANEGAAVTTRGIDALMASHLSVKRGAEIGRFGLGFKSVVGISSSPQIFSRSGSFGFDRILARERIEYVVPTARKYPTLRLAVPLNPLDEARADDTLAGLMVWATTVVRLPLLPGRDWLRADLQDFPSEFLLFSPHVAGLTLIDRDNLFEKSVSTSRRSNGAVILEEAGARRSFHVVRQTHRPSPRALKDAGELAHRDEIPVVWAVPEKARGRIGAFWAFFPTASRTTLSGIVNAPWKTNEDRHDLLQGAFNQEILVEVLPRMVAGSFPDIIDAEDPASVLDILPARGKEQRSWADDVINEPIFNAAAKVPCLPNVDGKLMIVEHLKLHPKDLREEWLAQWLDEPSRPSDWVHHSVDRTAERRLKAERLLSKVDRKARSLAEWLGALARNHDPGASGSAIVLAAKIVEDDSNFAAEIGAALIVRTQKGGLVRPEAGIVFKPSSGAAGLTGMDFVDQAVVSRPGVSEALESFGIMPVDQSGLLRSMVKAGTRNWDEEDWDEFWTTCRDVPPAAAADVLREELRDEGILGLKVRVLSGERQRLSHCLLPGRVVPADGGRDAAYAVDLVAHHADRDLLERLGVVAEPRLRPSAIPEEWLRDYAEFAHDRFLEALPERGPRPAAGFVEYSSAPPPGPLALLVQLSFEGQAQMTKAVLDLGPEEDAEVFHRTRSTYAPIKIEGPGTWLVKQYGRVLTALGPWPVAQALAPMPELDVEVLPVAQLSRGEASRLSLLVSPRQLEARSWSEVLHIARGWDDDNRRGRLYVAAARYIDVPTSITVRVGTELVEESPAATYVVCARREYEALVAQHFPVVFVENDSLVALLTEKWGLIAGSSVLSTEVAAAGSGESGPLMDRFPPLRHYLPPELESLELVPCSHVEVSTLTPSGRRTEYRDFVLHDMRLYVVLKDDRAFLRQLFAELKLSLTDEDIERILRQTDDHAARVGEAEIRRAIDDDHRLLLAVGEDALRRSLPQSALRAIEQRKGAKLEGADLARVAMSVHGVSVLSKFKDDLEKKGLQPPVQWAGTTRARRWVANLGFAEELAGFPSANRAAFMEVDGPATLPPLHDYQERVLERTRRLLRGEDRPRGLISLPTGAGKTRVAVEALVRQVREEGLDGPVVWIAQSGELCEQAVQTWSFVWRAVGPSRRLMISRLWGDNEAAKVEDGFHLVVAIDDKLTAVRNRPEYDWLSDASVVIVDEAHTSLSPTYTELLEWMGRGRARRQRPLIGLTATPFRGVNEEETRRLANRYDSNRLDDDAFPGVDPYEELQRRRILAKVRHLRIDGVQIDLSREDLAEIRRYRRVPGPLENKLGADIERNERIVRSLLTHDEDWTVLLFAASVENAETLAALLTVEGVPAAAISANTSPSARRHYIEQFQRREIRVITNYGVLAQGFDAPAVRAVYVTRPTFSPNVYQQMIGRGLRGTLNGGSEEVLIANVEDNFHQYGERLAFYDFEYLWRGGQGGP